MKSHILIIRTLMPDTTPSPTPSLIADLVDAVLKTPGMRVTSVEVSEIIASETVTRRVRNIKPTTPKAGLESHPFSPSLDNYTCKICGKSLEAHKTQA